MVTKQAMYESFFFNNIVPQVGPNMNRGIWVDLEKMVRLWSIERGEIQVFTGPIFKSEKDVVKMGRSAVWVPDYLYKVIIDVKTKEVISFVIPNVQVITRKVKSLDGGSIYYPNTLPQNAVNCGRVCTLDNFIVSVNQVETLTGLRFLPKLGTRYYVSDKMWHVKKEKYE